LGFIAIGSTWKIYVRSGGEWEIAENLHKTTKMRNIALFFKDISVAQTSNSGAHLSQLAQVLSFRKRIEEEKRYLFRQYKEINQFSNALQAYLAKWLRDHGSILGVPGILPQQITIAQVAGP
jgi:hypothetical protein